MAWIIWVLRAIPDSEIKNAYSFEFVQSETFSFGMSPPFTKGYIAISREIRYFLIQELRLLLSGSKWDAASSIDGDVMSASSIVCGFKMNWQFVNCICDGNCICDSSKFSEHIFV